MISTTLEFTPGELKSRTGWEIKPQGACKADVCIPLPSPVTNKEGLIDLGKLPEKLNLPLIHDEASGVVVPGTTVRW